MSDSSSDEDGYWIFYRDRPEWSDLKPVPLNDSNFSVIRIAYSDKYRDIYDYFRGVAAVGEKSSRALLLCNDALSLNPANYTVWQYRRDIIREINYDLSAEINFSGEMIRRNTKTYQVWYHRKSIVEEVAKQVGFFGVNQNEGSYIDAVRYGKDELSFTESILREDAKNYHAWQHRQWALKFFNLFDDELDFADGLITQDVRNNSAWNQRYFVISRTTGFTPEVINREKQYTMEAISLAISNESAWNYLRGILEAEEMGLNDSSVIDQCNALWEANKSSCQCVHLLAFLLDATIDLLQLEDSKYCDNKERRNWVTGQGKDMLEDILEKCQELERRDPIRTAYWKFIAGEQKISFSHLLPTVSNN